MKRTTRERVEEMKREIERRGSNLYVDDTLPLEVQELFLKEVLSCPDCIGGKKKNH